MIRAEGQLTEAVLNAIMAEAGGDLTHLRPGYAMWIDVHGTELGGHALDPHVRRLYALAVSMSPSKIGTWIDDVTVQM